MWYVACGLVGFALGWLVHTALSAKEFDKLLWQTEKDKQDLINQFNAKLEEGDKK